MNLHTIRLWVRHHYTFDNIVLTVAVLIAFGWLWGTMESLQNNFRLQGQVNNLKNQVERDSLETQNLELENQYYASSEYLELEARERLGKAAPGEYMLLLPPNTVSDVASTQTQTSPTTREGNFQAWINFFFGSK